MAGGPAGTQGFDRNRLIDFFRRSLYSRMKPYDHKKQKEEFSP